MNTSLSFRQERFVFEYLKDQNASAAAARAGYQAKNMAAQGHELLNHPEVRDRVRFEMGAILAEVRCTALELARQRVRAAFFDPRKLFRDGAPVAPAEMDEDTRAAVEVTTVTRKSGPVVRVKQTDRQRALRALEKVHERLDRLNEAYYRSLEKAGQLPTLEEIEAMDAVEAPAENPEKHRVLSGSASLPPFALGLSTRRRKSPWGKNARPSTGSGRTEVGCGISEKPRVLSGGRAPGLPRMSLLMAALVRAAGASHRAPAPA